MASRSPISHRAHGLHGLGADWFALVGETDNHSGHALAEIAKIRSEAQDGHDFGGGRDVEAVAPRHPVFGAAQADDDVAQRAFVQVNDPAQDDAARVESEFVAVLEMVVHHGAEEVVGLLHGVHVADKMKIDILGGHNLRMAAAGAAAFDTEVGPERWFAQAEHAAFAESAECVSEADGGGGLAFTLRGGGHGRHEDKPAVGLISSRLQFGKWDFGDVMAVGQNDLGVKAQFAGDFGDSTRRQAIGGSGLMRHNS